MERLRIFSTELGNFLLFEFGLMVLWVVCFGMWFVSRYIGPETRYDSTIHRILDPAWICSGAVLFTLITLVGIHHSWTNSKSFTK